MTLHQRCRGWALSVRRFAGANMCFAARTLYTPYWLGVRKRGGLCPGHENLAYSCGPGSPFEKMLELETKLLFFNIGFEYCTFEHYLEHRFRDSAPLPIYHPKPLEAIVIDGDRNRKFAKTYVFNPEYSRRQNSSVLKHELSRGGFLKRCRIGNTRLLMVSMTADYHQ